MRLEDFTPNFLTKFQHRISNKVRFHEVDSFGVAHNLAYFYWLEVAQTEYFENLGFDVKPETFTKEFPLLKVHNEIDYFSPLRLGDKYQVLTRISWIKNSSFEYQNLVLSQNGNIVAFGKSVLVHINPKTMAAEELPTRFIELVRIFERGYVEQLKDLNGLE
ncbi:MAG: acyl-CoA thioesterase [Candidatus Kapaibacteriota bacterium]|jgi:acyl-CoA thioester hydrolase